MKVLFSFLIFCFCTFPVYSAAVKDIYRLGVPLRFSTPIYKALLKSLHDFGYIEGENLKLVKIDMHASRDISKREEIRKQIQNNIDMMFLSCDKLRQFYKLNMKKPTLFFGPKGMNYNPSKEIIPYLTGVWRGDIADIFTQLNIMIPDGEFHSIGVPYIKGSNFEDILSYIKVSAERVGVDIITKGYTSNDDIENMMRFFKKNVKAVFFIPPAIKDEDIKEIVKWQDELNIPVLSQLKKHVEAGMLGGIVLNMDVILPKLTEYIDKILKGRNPSQLPIFTSDLKHIINLNVVSKLNVKIPREVIRISEITGIAQLTSVTKNVHQTKLIDGHYKLGLTVSVIDEVKDKVLKTLEIKGYKVGYNLDIVTVDLNSVTSEKGKKKIISQLESVDVLFITDNAVYDILALNIKQPVVLLGISDINDIPPNVVEHYTGVWRASCRKVLNMAKKMFPDVKKIGMVYRKETRMNQIIYQHNIVAEAENIRLIVKSYESKKDIPGLMESFADNVDIVLLFPAGVIDNDINEFIKMQNKLKLPTLSHLKHHIEMGLVGGPTVDLDKVVPRLSDYIHKIFQGRVPSQLKAYQYIPKYVINLSAAGNLDVKIPRSVIRQSTIIN